MDQFWGDRYANVSDPFGYRWSMGTHKEDLTRAEIEQRGRAAFEKMHALQKQQAG
jgi:hypothetical protein